MNKISKNICKAISIIIIFIVLTLLSRYAWAKYMTRVEGNSSGDIAKFIFNVSTNTEENMVVNLAQTRTGIKQEAEVHSDYIGPGTLGAFQIEINSTNSEVSIEYNIQIDVDDVNNTRFPKNLIFYSDEGMKNALYHENGFINLNGLIAANDNQKVKTIDIYWKWDFETGQAEDDKRENDNADSAWVGRSISLPITVLGQQVNVNSLENQYEVTLDANGGIFLDGYGNSNKIIKKVSSSGQYGELPTPCKEGYQFDGWIGKNLFNTNSILMAIPGITYENGYYTFYAHNGYEKYYGGIQDVGPFKENTIYTLTMEGYSIPKFERSTNFRFFFVYTDGTSDEMSAITLNNQVPGQRIYPSKKGKTVKYLGMSYGYSGTVYLSKVQLEEGEISTDYEDYYTVTKTTEFNNNQNMNLYAHWVPIEKDGKD